MAFIPAPAGTVRLSLEWSLRGQACANVLHYKYAAAPTYGELAALAGTVAADVTTDLLPGLGPQLTLTQVVATHVQAAGGTQAVVGVGSPGTAGTDCISNMQALCVSLKTAVSGKSGRGRIYLPGIPEGALAADPNYVTSGGASALATAVETSLLDGPAGLLTPATLVVTSYYTLNGAPPPVTIPRVLAVNNTVTLITANTRLDTQRRRRPA